MKNFKQFSEELNEAVSTGYKEPVDLGAGWEKPVLSNSGFWGYNGKGKYKGLKAEVISLSKLDYESNYSHKKVGIDVVPEVVIYKGIRVLGVVRFPLLVKGKPKGHWRIGLLPKTAKEMPGTSEPFKHDDTTSLKMNDSIKQIVDRAIELFGPKIENPKPGASTGGDSLDSLKMKIRGFLGGSTRVVDELYGKQVAGFEVRHWGQWEFPKDEYDDGDGDYDWEVLTAASSKKIKDFVAGLNASQKEYKISWTTGEKNWITVYISKA